VGLAFQAHTDDMREASVPDLMEACGKRRYPCSAFDPEAWKNPAYLWRRSNADPVPAPRGRLLSADVLADLYRMERISAAPDF